MAIGKSMPLSYITSILRVVISSFFTKGGSSVLLCFQKDILKKELTTFTFFQRFRKWARVDFSLETALSSVCSWLEERKKKAAELILVTLIGTDSRHPCANSTKKFLWKSHFCPPRFPPLVLFARLMYDLVVSGPLHHLKQKNIGFFGRFNWNLLFKF